MGGCTSSAGPPPGQAPVAPAAQQVSAPATPSRKEEALPTDKVVPCEFCGSLHNVKILQGPYAGFCTMKHQQAWRDGHTARAKAVEACIMERWQDLDADFMMSSAARDAGIELPPLSRFATTMEQQRRQQERLHRDSLALVSDSAVTELCVQVPALWPAGTEEAAKELCIQPESCTTMSESYVRGSQVFEHLRTFATCLASATGCHDDKAVRLGVKCPVRFRNKAATQFPSEVVVNDFRHISDVYRASIVADKGKQLIDMLEILRFFGRGGVSRTEPLHKMNWVSCTEIFVVERIKNRFVKPARGGYRDVLVNLRINGYVTELQLHLKQIYEVVGGRSLAKWFKYYDFGQLHAGLGWQVLGSPGNCSKEPMCSSGSAGTYTGESVRGLRHGRGTFLYTNGDRYEGQWANGQKHGSGTYHYASGARYTGEFQNDKCNGHGNFSNREADDWYEGEFRDGARHGEGTWHRKDGAVIHGRWWRNKRCEQLAV